MSIVSQAVVPPQPNTAVYGADDLQLFKTFDRASYLAAAGEDAPTYDKMRKTKAWLDTDAATKADSAGNVTYTNLSAVQNDLAHPSYDKMVMSVAEASTVNLYGIHSYPPYQVAPSGATSGAATIQASFLSMQGDAQALMQAVGASNLMQEPGNAFDPIVYAPTEARRLWGFLFKGTFLLAGPLIVEMNANGVGAPGHWDLTGGEPNWISDLPSSLPPANPAWAVPQRQLLPNEILIRESLSWAIQRTDMSNPAQPSTGAGGAGLTTVQDQAVSETHTIAKGLAKMFNIAF